MVIQTQLPSWAEMRASGSLNEIIAGTLPLVESDPTAARHFLRIFTQMGNLFLLDSHSIELLEQAASKCNRYARYALGRFHICTQDCDDAVPVAVEHLAAAYNDHLPDAAVALALMFYNGDIGSVDRDKAADLLTEAFNEHSEYAAEVHIRNMIYGLNGYEKNPAEAIVMAEGLIAADLHRYGEGEENPMWHYLKACAEQALKGIGDGIEEFMKATEMGVITAWSDLAIACSHNADGELVDEELFRETVRTGCDKKDYLCMYLQVALRLDDFENYPECERMAESESMAKELEIAFLYGSNEAAECLGDMYYNGSYGRQEDKNKAWYWYSSGALLNNASCYEKMFAMIEDGHVEQSEEVRDVIALSGARLGSINMTREAVSAYREGRLEEYSEEIEKYWVPIADSE